MGFVVGLTGGIGSGKSTVAKEFEHLGVRVVDSDEVAREVVAPGEHALEEIFAHFGADCRLTNGQLNRAALRQRVFDRPEERRWLEALLHPLIHQRTRQQLAVAPGLYAILMSPLLLESGQDEAVDQVLVVDLPTEQQIQRTCSRDANNEKQVRAILATQLSREERRARADHILDNSQPEASLPQRVAALHEHFCTLAAIQAGQGQPNTQG